MSDGQVSCTSRLVQVSCTSFLTVCHHHYLFPEHKTCVRAEGPRYLLPHRTQSGLNPVLLASGSKRYQTRLRFICCDRQRSLVSVHVSSQTLSEYAFTAVQRMQTATATWSVVRTAADTLAWNQVERTCRFFCILRITRAVFISHACCILARVWKIRSWSFKPSSGELQYIFPIPHIFGILSR